MAKNGRALKKARRRGATIVFVDEAGFLLQPVNRRTWAPRGCTPEQRAWDRRDRLSVIGVVTLSPARSRIGSYFDVQRENIRSAASRIAAARWKRIEFEPLPAYAPELNPVEAMWSHAKYADLANYVPDDVDELDEAVRASLRDQSRNHLLKRSFFKTAQLRL